MLLLVAAVMLALVLAAAHRPGITGRAFADWPPPPAVGSCVGVPGGQQSTVVPCDRPHLQEVTATFDATDPRLDTVARHWDNYCVDASSAYMNLQSRLAPQPLPNTGISPWAPLPPQYGYNIMHAPKKEQVAGKGWLACIVRPQNQQPYRGSIHAAGNSTSRPGAFGTCGDDTPWLASSARADCAGPHGWEVLGQAGATSSWYITENGSRALSNNAAAMTQQCADFAAAVMGVADPTYRGVLQTGVGLVLTAPALELPPASSTTQDSVSQSTAPDAGGAALGMVEVTCRIAPTNPNQRLTNSMVGWGGEPPPLTKA